MGHSSRASHIPPTSSGGGGPADGNDNWPYIVVYDPDDTLTGDNRFTDWTTLIDFIATIDGPKFIHCAYTVEIPTGAWDLNGASWVGRPGPNPTVGTGIYVYFPEGCTISNMGYEVKLGICLVSNSTTHPTVTMDDGTDLLLGVSDYGALMAAFKFFSMVDGNLQITLANQGAMLDPSLNPPNVGTVAGAGRVVYFEAGYAFFAVILHSYGVTTLADNVMESVDPFSWYRFNTALGTQFSQGDDQVNMTMFPFNFATAENIDYTPANSGDWAGDPSNSGSAIDRIAAVVAVLNGAPIP